MACERNTSVHAITGFTPALGHPFFTSSGGSCRKGRGASNNAVKAFRMIYELSPPGSAEGDGPHRALFGGLPQAFTVVFLWPNGPPHEIRPRSYVAMGDLTEVHPHM